MATTSLVIMNYIAMEIMYESSVEYIINSQNLHRIKAYYAAKAGLDISLLRLKLYVKIAPTVKNLVGQNVQMLDQIWQFPFAWPLKIPAGATAITTDDLKKSEKESLMDAKYDTLIELEGTKIDLNDLISPSKGLRELTKKQILNLFERKKIEDKVFFDKYSNLRLEESVVNPLIDWMSDKSASANGGSKKEGYQEFESEDFPPNRSFITVDEVRLVKGMNDELFNVLRPAITVYGMKAINVNKAPSEVLKSLDPNITDKAVQAVIAFRDDPKRGPFKKPADGQESDFWEILERESNGRLSDETKKIPITYEDYFNFRIISKGEYSKISRSITAIVIDIEKQADVISKYVKEEKQKEQGQNGQQDQSQPPATPGPNATTNQNKSASTTKGPPRIVYYNER
ncbi:MAG: general secretion pathway protein GspK [Pseudobdellovibrionaceae bacterium]